MWSLLVLGEWVINVVMTMCKINLRKLHRCCVNYSASFNKLCFQSCRKTYCATKLQSSPWCESHLCCCLWELPHSFVQLHFNPYQHAKLRDHKIILCLHVDQKSLKLWKIPFKSLASCFFTHVSILLLFKAFPIFIAAIKVLSTTYYEYICQHISVHCTDDR